MLYVFRATDAKDSGDARSVNYPAHHAHLDNTAVFNVRIIMSGPLLGDDENTPIGSLFIVEAADRATAENYFKNDPFYKTGVWDTSHLMAFKRVKG